MSMNRATYAWSAQKYSFPPKTIEKRCDSPKSSLYTSSMSKPIGLTNIGNTCFLNSIIQFLYAAQEVREALIAKYGAAKEMSNGKFGKLLGMIFKYIKDKDKKYQTLQKQKEILSNMVSKLEQINNQYQRHFQEDALETLLNVLNEIQNKHPQITKKFDIEYSSKCRCCQFVAQDRMISYSQVKCMKCGSFNQIKLVTAPKYIIYSNPSKRLPQKLKVQKGQGQKGPYTYIEKARIIYIGNGKSGHYVVQREEDTKWYQFSDETVDSVDGKRSLRGINSNGLILLYELQQVKKDPVLPTRFPLTRSSRISNPNDNAKALQSCNQIVEQTATEMLEQEEQIQKIPVDWVSKVKVIRKYLSNFQNTILLQQKFVMTKMSARIALRTIRRDHQNLKVYHDFNSEYNRLKNQSNKDAYAKILAQYLLGKLYDRPSFSIFSSHIQKNKISETDKWQLKNRFNSNQDEMYTVVIVVTM